MKTIKLLALFATMLLLVPGFSFAGINPDGDDPCPDNSPPTPKAYTVTVDLPGILDCSAMNGCGCTFQITLYACTSCSPPSGCTQIGIPITYVYGVTSYPFPKFTADPSVTPCICAHFEDTTPGGCGCTFNASVDCHNIANDPNTTFTLRLYPCYH